MRLNQRLLVAPVIAVSAIAVAACGGSSKPATTTTHHSTIPASAFLGTHSSSGATNTTSATTHSTANTSTHLNQPKPKHPTPPKAQPKPASLGPALTASVMAQKADAACSSYHASASGISQPSDFSSNTKSAAAYLEKLVKLDLTETNALHFNPPRAEELNYAHFFGAVLHHHLLLTIAWDEAQSGKHDYGTYYSQAASYKTSTLAPLARQLHFTSCAS